MEKRVYEFVKKKGKVTRDEVIKELGLSESELVKEHSEGGQMHLIPIG